MTCQILITEVVPLEWVKEFMQSMINSKCGNTGELIGNRLNLVDF